MHALDRVALQPSGRQLGQVIGDCRQPEHARAALLRSLARQVRQDPGGLGQPAAFGRQDVEDGSPRRAADRPQPGCGERQACHLADVMPGAEVPADQHGPRGQVRSGHGQHLAESGPGFDLVHAGLGDRAGHRGQHGARRVGQSGLAEPGGAVSPDKGHVRERLDVVDQSGAAADTTLERTWRRVRGLGLAAVQPVHQRGFLTRHVLMRQAMHTDRNALEVSPPPLVDRGEHAVDEPVPSARQTQMRLARADSLCRQHDPVQHQVWRAGQQGLVFLAGRLALHAVRDDHGQAPL